MYDDLKSISLMFSDISIKPLIVHKCKKIHRKLTKINIIELQNTKPHKKTFYNMDKNQFKFQSIFIGSNTAVISLDEFPRFWNPFAALYENTIYYDTSKIQAALKFDPQLWHPIAKCTCQSLFSTAFSKLPKAPYHTHTHTRSIIDPKSSGVPAPATATANSDVKLAPAP